MCRVCLLARALAGAIATLKEEPTRMIGCYWLQMPHGRSLVCTCVRVCGLMWLLLQEVAEVMFMTFYDSWHQTPTCAGACIGPWLSISWRAGSALGIETRQRHAKTRGLRAWSNHNLYLYYSSMWSIPGNIKCELDWKKEEDNVRHVTCFSFHFVPIGSSLCYANGWGEPRMLFVVWICLYLVVFQT